MKPRSISLLSHLIYDRVARPQVRFTNLHSSFFLIDSPQGYPLSDLQVHEFFIGNVTNRSTKDVQFRYLSFFVVTVHQSQQHD